MAFSSPHEGSYDCWYCVSVPQSYWLSPRGSTALAPVIWSAVHFSWHSVLVPLPPLLELLFASHAISPAAMMMGPFGLTVAVGVGDTVGVSVPVGVGVGPPSMVVATVKWFWTWLTVRAAP